MKKEEITVKLLKLIDEEFFDDSNKIDKNTLLISSNLLDSMEIMVLTDLIETNFNIELNAHEIKEKYLDNVSKISELVLSKISNE